MVEESQGISRPGLLPISKHNSRKVTVKCEDCGADFESTIWIRPDNSELPPDTMCPDCTEIKRRADEQEEMRQELITEQDTQRERWKLLCGLPEKGFSKTFDTFEQNLQLKAFNAMLEAVNEFKSLVLYSPNVYGVGKTHLVTALAAKIIMEARETATRVGYNIKLWQCPVYFTTEPKMLARIRQTYNRDEGETEEDIYLELLRVPLLIIDDIGKVRPRDPSHLLRVYFRIIDDRYNDEKPVIITTNLNLEELEAHIGGACADRLREMCGKNGFIKMGGKSYRMEKKK